VEGSPVKIPRPLVNQLLHHAQRGGRHEICGLVTGRDGHPTRAVPVTNIAATPATRYEMDPKGLIDALRGMREAGETLFAIYHSHPSSPPAPSAMDTAQANYPEALYLIVSLNTKGMLEMRGYRLRDGVFDEVRLEVE
jgi:proteasome lid subunit RPN8/RPN11